MQLISTNFVIYFIYLCESASVYNKQNGTLEVIKNDISQVTNAVENFTFDILKQIIQPEESEEITTTRIMSRETRSVDDDVDECFKQCRMKQDNQTETQKVKELKNEMKKLQQLVKLLKEQQKIIHVLDEDDVEIKENPEDVKPDELTLIKSDLEEAIKDLNETKQFIMIQKEKDEYMEDQLKKQEDEIEKLREIIDTILDRNSTNSTVVSARSSEFQQLRKLLKTDDDDDDDDDLDETHSKLIQLEKQIKKRKKQQDLAKELKALEQKLEENNSGNLLKQLEKALSKTDDEPGINNLADLQEAINKLRPKENNDAAQFQAVLNKLINNQPSLNSNQQQSQFTFTPQQMNEMVKKLTQNNRPYICIVDDRAFKNKPSPYYQYPQRSPQFFPEQGNYPQSNLNQPYPEKPVDYQQQGGIDNSKYQQDLKQQIDGLQDAIDNLNRPDVTQKPEDKAMVDNLQRQIADLRNIVNNLNNDENNRAKRTTDNNQVEDTNEIMEEMTNLVGKILDKDDKSTNIDVIQNKINSIKKELGNKERVAAPPYYPNFYQDDLSNTLAKSSIKNDFFVQLVAKVLDKVIAIIPTVINKLFGFSFDELSRNDYQDYDVQMIFKNLGIFGYLPVILLRLIKGFTYFLRLLKKNNFFRTFLMPAIILATVAGSVLFLIWWLQPDDTPNYSDYNYANNDQNYYKYPAGDNYNKYPVSDNYMVYNRSYFNK